MPERIFTDENGLQLIVRHRKSAVFFLRKTDTSIEGYVSPYWKDKTPVVNPSEISRKYTFSPQAFKDFADYMEQIAQESWKNFNPRVADSLGADYVEYFDKEFGTEGSLDLSKNELKVEGPYQPKTNDPIIRLYKFNKRKFESFVFDLREKLI